MVTIEKVDPKSKSQVRRFIRIPFDLYAGNPHWVPPLNIDSETFLNHDKHPFYEHSEADFFIAVKDGQDVGRICALVNNPFNKYHDKKQALFYFLSSLEYFEQQLVVMMVKYAFLIQKKTLRSGLLSGAVSTLILSW